MAQDRYDLLAQRLSAEYDDLPTTGAELKKWFKDDSTRAGQLYDVMTKDGINTGAKSKDAFVNFYGSGGYAMGQQSVTRNAGQKTERTGASLQTPQLSPFNQPAVSQQSQQVEEPVDYPRRPTSYTDQGALFRLNDERMQRNADIARNVLEQNPVIKEQKRKSQPVTTTGTPADQYVIKTQGQFENEVHQSAADNAKKLFGTGVDYEVGRVIDDATKRWEKAFDPRGMVGEGAEISALARANNEIDPERLTQDLTNELKNRIGGWLQQEGKPEALVEEANRLGISPDDYANMVVNEITSQAQQKLDQKVLEGYMPKGKADYIINGLHDSLIGTLMDMTTMTKGQRQMMQRANQQYSEQNKKDDFWGGTITDLVRGGVGFMGDAPVFGALGKVASPMVRGTGALLENMGVRTTMGMSDAAFQRLSQTVLNNSSWLQRMKFGADRAIAGSAYNFGLYEGMGNVVNDLSVGDDTSLGTLAGDFIEGFAKGSAKGAVLGAFSRPAQAVSPKFGVRSDMGIGQKVLVGTGKGALATGNIMSEGLGFTAGEYLVDEAARERVKNSDNPLNVILQDTMENTMMAGIFKIMNGHNMLHPVESMRKAFEASADSRFRFQDWQKKEIEDAYGSKESFVKTMEDIARSADSERNTKMSRFYEDFMNRNDISWDTKNKVSALLTGNMATVPPIPSRISIDQDKKEVVAFGRNGEVLFRRAYESPDEADAIKGQLQMSREEQMLHNLIGTFLVKDKDGNVNPESQKQLDDAITEIGYETALNKEGMINALNKAPEKRSEMEQYAVDELFNRLYEVRFPANQPHPAQDHQDGRDLADKTLNMDELDPAKNPNGVEPGKYDQLTQAYDEANKTLEEVFKKDDTFYQFVKEQRANGLSDGEIALEARKMAFGEEEAQALIDYERAKEQVNGYIELTAERIGEYVSNEVSGMVFKGELDGQPVNDRFVRVVDDEGNTYYLRTGKVTVGEDGRLVSTDGSGTVIVRDASGKDKMVRADSVSMAPEDPENPMRDDIAAYSQLRTKQLEEAISLAIDADGKLQQPSEPKSQGQLAYEQEQGDVEQNGGLVRNDLAEQTLSETLRGSLHQLGRKIGKKIQVVTKDELKQINPSAPDNARGMRSADNKTLYLVSDYVKDSDYMQRFVTGHELTHSIKAESGDGKVWNDFVNAVREHMGDKAFDEAVKHVEDLYEKSGIHLDRNGAIEEVCSDWAGDNLMQDEASIRHIVESMERAGRDPLTFTQRIKQLFDDMIAAITGSGRTLSSDEKAQLERLVKARDLWEQMYNECVAKNEARDKAAEAKRLAEEKTAEERKAREDNGVVFGADGEADYLRMTPDATIADLSEQAGPELVGSVVGTMLKNAEKALKGIKDVKPASEKPSDVIAAAKETAAMKKAAQEAVDYWKSVSERNKELEAEAKAEAKRKAEEEARLQAEAERQERLKTPEGRAAEIAKAKVEDRPKVAQEIYGEAFNGDMTPNGVDEYIMSYFSGKIPELGEGFIDTDSFESETGHKVDGFNGDSKAYYRYLAGRGKGKTLKQVSEEIWHSMPEAMHEMTNDADIMNKVSELLTGAEKATDIRDALLNSRIREAERILSGESRRAEEQEAEADVEEPAGGGMTTEMPFAPFEGEAPFSLEKAAEQNGASYSLVEDPAEMERLDKEKTIKKLYRSVQLDKEGNARSPIASKLGRGSGKVETSGIVEGQWEKADEHPELVDENGKIVLDKGDGNGTLTVAYNPYIHTSRSMINDQFASAWKRDNIVVIETEVPESELTAGYHADKAKDAVGEHPWKSGPVGRKLPKERQRKVILSRWDKPFRTVPWEEVADDYARTLEGLDIEVPFNVVPKALLPLLVERGIKIGEPEKGNAGDAARPAYEEWKKGNSQYSLSEDPIKAIEQSAEKFRKEKEEWKPAFYSNAQKAVEGIKQDKATPEQWLAMLQKNGGLKAGEDKWIGLSDWLKEKKGSVTKQEIEDYIRQNQIQVEEKQYHEAPQGISNKLKDLNKEYTDICNKLFYEIDDPLEIADKAFEQMKEKYGEDFENAVELVSAGHNVFEIAPQMGIDDLPTGDAMRFLGIDPTHVINDTRLSYTTKGLDNYKEIALTVPTIEPYNEGDQIHFGDAGGGRAVAWVRFGETTDADGNKVLVIDEIQSKRHQEGRENGYKGNLSDEEWEIASKWVAANDVIKRQNDRIPRLSGKMLKEAEDAIAEAEGIKQELIDTYGKEYVGKLANKMPKTINSVPDAPFDKNWHELAMKRMLRYAAENGYDKIAWTTGEQQADRYDLSHQIDEIQSIRNGGGYQVSAMKDGKAVFENWYDSESKLAEDFGKDIANKVFSNQEVGNKQSFKGLDLKVGGEGMAGFYDQILPRFMDKYGKKWGVKTGEIELPNLEESARKMHSIDVTPEMKESVMQGQPMFSLAGKDSAEEIKPVGTGDFGDIYDQFKGKPKEAIDFLLKKKSGEAVGALSHKDVGDIDLVWGEEGTGKSDGFGLAKLAKYHPEVLDNLQEILDDMHVVNRTENRVNLESDTHKASVRLTWNERKKKWLLTAFEKKNSALDNTTDTDKTSNRGKRNDTATPQSTVSESKDTKNIYSLQENKEEKTKINTSDPMDAISQAAEDFRKKQEKKKSVEELRTMDSEVDTQKDDVLYSVHDILKEEERNKVVKDLMRVTGRSEKTCRGYLKAEESLAKVILDNDNVGFLDLQVDESVPSIWNNSDYPQGTVEFSNICRKRLPFTSIYQRLQKEYPNTVFDASTLETIRRVMKENGEDVACGLCYVEDRRQMLGEIGKGFVDMVKGEYVNVNDNQRKALDKLRESGDDYVPDLYELLTLDGMKKLRREHPAVAQAFIEYNNARGMQAGRLFQAYSAYHRDILKYPQSKVESINNNGGLRIFSFSDFEAHHLIDLVQVLTDCASKGIKVQGYTKVPEFAKAIKDTGMKLNRSLIPKDEGFVDADYVPKDGEAVSPNVVNGKRLLLDTVEGIDVNHPDFFDSTDNKNVGNIVVGINDEHIRTAMQDPFVDYIIPFHSGLSESIRKQKGIGDWVNYKLSQLEKRRTEGGKLVNADKHGINIYTDVLPRGEELIGREIKNARDFQAAFFKACEEKGWVPRFEQFIDRAKNGNYKYTPGYEKLLLDFKLFDSKGRIVPQEPVKPIFDNEFNKKILDDYVKGEKERIPNDDVYNKVKESLGLDEQSKFSLIGSQGAESMDKAEGTTRRIDNRRTAEEMENAGKDSKTIWAATGWARGKDGKWRYEIPDFKEFSAAGIVEYKKEHPATMEERKRFTELNYKKVDGEDGYGEPLTEEELQEWAGLKAKINPTGYAKEQGKLSDFIDAPELFEAYPALKDMPVEVVDLGGEFSGMYTNDGSILLDKSRVDKAINGDFDERLSANAELKDTMVHEIQHAIQAIEGFARGDNPHRLVSGSEIGDDAYKRSAGEVEARNTEKRRLMSERHRKKTIPENSEDTPREDQIVYTGESDGKKFSLTEDTSDPIKTIERASKAWKEERKVFGTKPKVHAETSHGGRVAIEDNKEPSIEDEYAHYSLSSSPTNTPLQTDENRRYHELIGGKAFKWIEAHQNDLQSVIAMQKAILGDNVDAKDYENVFYAMNHMGGVVMQKENNYARHYYSRINSAANEAAAKMRGNDKNKKYQEAMDEVEDYIMMKHGLERNRSLYVRDHADDQAKADFANLMESLYNDLRARRITFADYLGRMDDFIRSRVDAGYTADKHDMSGLSNKNAAGYDDAAMTKEVMDTEALYGEALTDELWDSINSATDYILNERYESGLMSKAEKERLERQWHFYVPLQGWAEPTAEEMFDYTDHMMTSVGSPVLKRAGGRTSKADDPLAMIGANASRLIRDAELNRVHQTAVRLSRGHAGNGLLEEMQTWYEKTGTDASGNPIWEEAFPQWAPNATADDITQAIQQFNADMQAKQQSGDARKTKRGLNIRYPMAVPSHVRQHIINAWIGGEKVRLYVQGDPRAAQALNGELRQGTDNKFVKGWDAVNRLMMGLNTSYNPEFIVSNGERDLEMATNNLLVKEGREYTGRFLKNYLGIGGGNTTGNTGLLKGETLGMGRIGKRINAFNGIWNRYYNNTLDMSKESDRMFKEFMDNGGPTGYVTNQNLDKYKKQLYQGVREKDGNIAVKALTKLLADPFSWALNSIEELNTRVENLTRFAAYQTSRQGGRSILQSIHDAKEVSVNFGTRGAGGNTSGAAGMTAAWGRHTFYFYNAGVQSLEMYARNIRKHPIKGVATMMLKPFMVGCAVALWNMLNGSDDETGEKSYAQLNPWVRRNNLIIPAGDGAYWTYPLPIEIRAFYGMGEAAAGMFFEETRDPNPALTMAGQVTQMIPIDVLSYMSEQPKDITDLALRFGTTLLPSVIQSDIVQPAVNMNFYGAPLEKEPNPFDEFQPRWGRTFMRDQNTSVYRAAKWLEQNTRTSPSEHSDPESPEMTKQQKGYIDISPALAKHMIDNIFGGTGAWVMRLGDATRNGWEWLANDGDSPMNNSRSIPFVRTNYRSATHDRGEGRQRARMYDLKKMMKNVEDNLKFYYKDKDVNPEHYLRFMELWDSEDGQIYRDFHNDLKTIDSYDRKVKQAPEGEAKRNAQQQLNEKRRVLLEQIDKKKAQLEDK